MNWLSLLLLLSIYTTLGESRKRCVKAIGRVRCPTDWDRHYRVTVKLMDKDPLPWEADDEMGTTQTDEDGNYVVQGCGEDLGAWNDPDPYILVEHRCPEPGHTISIPRRARVVTIERKYLPEIVYVETVRIDENTRF
ncbi:unnamed protein product [Bursaphelenchus xylophilus]|uniref:(pine wood nematode) hypothetical protein n=1 Tax=Bursaphelenchus xylophilus TaxID=6326 RepID=A0A1I7SBB7_BURXY|nr:unnamed protein product [Bursaphelenchus xylophilus]CAG9131978.1 unnamed protein product [Bursaphelenchus xylophilus]